MMWNNLPVRDKLAILGSVERQVHISNRAIEKDWWVTMVLHALFNSPYAKHLVFKGGTSLSKAWHLIERFSEDIDIEINREYLGFGGALSKNQISDRLRRASCSFVRNELSQALEKKMLEMGIPAKSFTITTTQSPVSTTDPETIYIAYESVFTDTAEYVKNVVLVEAGSRSMFTPNEIIPVQSFIGEFFPDDSFSDKPYPIRTASASRTFLEKAFLLHEEFNKPIPEIRYLRMSRHLYDLEKMMDTQFAADALTNIELYKTVVEHRRKFIGLRGFDYDSLYPKTISFLPPESVKDLWKSDYRIMQENIIYGNSLDFDSLLLRISHLIQTFRNLSIDPPKS